MGAIHGGGPPTSAPCFRADNYLDCKFLLFCKVSTQPQSSGFGIESHFLDGEAGALKGLSCSFGVPDTVSSNYGHELRMEVGLCPLHLTSGETLSTTVGTLASTASSGKTSFSLRQVLM